MLFLLTWFVIMKESDKTLPAIEAKKVYKA